jgi:beta-glucosidase
MYFPSSPLAEIRRLAPRATVTFVDGSDPAAAAEAARAADVAIVFATQWSSESIDVPMALDGNQDALIAAVATANPRTAVVLETNAGVAMPWAARVPAILEAWYPGAKGGRAVANVLTGRVNPSGHLPVTFYASEAQLPRPIRPGGKTEMDEFALPYAEGAAVGYKWVDRNKLQPLFPFGHGLSYTSFYYTRIAAAPAPSGGVRVEFTIHNGGHRAGMAVGQIYASPANGGWEAPRRLVGFGKVDLAPDAAKTVSVDVDPRLLATFDESARAWRIVPGSYTFALGASSRELHATTTITLPELTLPANWRPGQAAVAPAPQRGERGR